MLPALLHKICSDGAVLLHLREQIRRVAIIITVPSELSSMSVTSEATNALAFCLKRIEAEFKDVPDGQEMVDKLTAKFVQTSNAPPRQDFEFVMRKPFSDDEVCIALFSPREDQIPYYAAMLVAAQELPAGNPVSKLCPLLVSLLFLVHRYTDLLIVLYFSLPECVFYLQPVQEELGFHEGFHRLWGVGLPGSLYRRSKSLSARASVGDLAERHRL